MHRDSENALVLIVFVAITGYGLAVKEMVASKAMILSDQIGRWGRR